MSWLAVVIGSAVGGAARYGVGLAMHRFFGDELPVATLVVNTLGCLVVGFLSSAGGVRFDLSHEAKLLLVTGFCGGFTTFSAFILESEGLFRSGGHAAAAAYLVLTLILGIAAFAAGGMLGRMS